MTLRRKKIWKRWFPTVDSKEQTGLIGDPICGSFKKLYSHYLQFVIISITDFRKMKRVYDAAMKWSDNKYSGSKYIVVCDSLKDACEKARDK
jgi:hypothetical protein